MLMQQQQLKQYQPVQRPEQAVPINQANSNFGQSQDAPMTKVNDWSEALKHHNATPLPTDLKGLISTQHPQQESFDQKPFDALDVIRLNNQVRNEQILRLQEMMRKQPGFPLHRHAAELAQMDINSVYAALQQYATLSGPLKSTAIDTKKQEEMIFQQLFETQKYAYYSLLQLYGHGTLACSD